MWARDFVRQDNHVTTTFHAEIEEFIGIRRTLSLRRWLSLNSRLENGLKWLRNQTIRITEYAVEFFGPLVWDVNVAFRK